MGKMKIGFNGSLIASVLDILTSFFLEMFFRIVLYQA